MVRFSMLYQPLTIVCRLPGKENGKVFVRINRGKAALTFFNLKFVIPNCPALRALVTLLFNYRWVPLKRRFVFYSI